MRVALPNLPCEKSGYVPLHAAKRIILNYKRETKGRIGKDPVSRFDCLPDVVPHPEEFSSFQYGKTSTIVGQRIRGCQYVVQRPMPGAVPRGALFGACRSSLNAIIGGGDITGVGWLIERIGLCCGWVVIGAGVLE